jgi:hypothetical protein
MHLGCGDDGPETETETETETESGTIDPVRRHQGEPIAPHTLAELTERTGGRIAHVRGTVTLDDAAASQGGTFAPETILTTGSGGSATVDLVREMRVEIGPGARVERGSLRDGEIFLHMGALRGALPPIGGGARPALRIGTPAGSVVLAGAGDILVAALPSGDTWVAAFAGAVAVSRNEVEGDEAERRLVVVTLLEGHAVLLGRSAIAEPTEAPERLEAGWSTARTLMRESPPLGPAEVRALEASARARYDESLGWLEAELERGEALADEQRRAASTDPPRARELTREIVAHSQRRVRLKEIALCRLEQLAAASGFGGTGGAEERLSAAVALLSE